MARPFLSLKTAITRNSGSLGGKVYLAYVAKALEKLQDWKVVMKYQRKNGSLFNFTIHHCSCSDPS
ncbi:ent-kaur-16-ene synthase, chloroplastic isoform X1 [Cinnamomum micranthum f. kanehirae]|uniref:Ent-kaur-16-ene synthase, chloroplastic isoform X1 n=1 Tax=Cinnamomum micranthum f. kanehirae TaxID=337451 RepID=A0A443PCL5_9MAGN|nr:ent-kaur-16-ene synthase, chloroplastic isoform X1 [Cinnamomum micranthum f. kanehirae]